MDGIDESRRWLEWLYGQQPDGLIWIGGHGDGFKGRVFTEIESAARYGQELDTQSRGGVYHRLTTMRHVDEGRGAAVDSAYLPGFAMDLDIKGPGHKALNYPETEQDLITLLRKAGLPEPSVWVHSGGGRYPFWKLEQPADLTLPGALEQAAATSLALHKLVIEWAADSDWKVDNTSDLARIYRLPGTHNRKAGEPIMARVCWEQSDHSSTFPMAGLENAVSTAPRVRERIESSAVEQAGDPGGWESQLFSPGAGLGFGEDRRFTTTEAMAYVQPALEALRGAQDGEINNRLNDAAVMLAHFGEEFWSREAAERQLLAALEQTAYDGGTWQAHTTITSAYNAIATKAGPEFWRAHRLPDPIDLNGAVESTPADAVEALLAEMLTLEQVKDQPPKKHLIKGLLLLDTESWMIGAPGAKKSFVALDMAAHVAAGREWQGRKVHQGPVVIIAAEGAGGIGARVKAWEKEHGQLPVGVRILPRPVQAADTQAWAVLVKACERLAPVMVIGDTQARLTVGLEENSAKEMGIYIAAIGAIKRATKACVLSIHHTGRADRDARGSNAIDGAQDTELKVVASSEKLRGELRVEKQKDLPEVDPIPLAFSVHVVGVDEDGEAITSLAVRGQDAWREAEASVAELEPWEAGHAAVVVQLFKVLREQGQERGLTKAEARGAVVERFYGGQVKALNKSTWYTGWDRAMGKISTAGDPVMVSAGGQRWSVDPVALAALEPNIKTVTTARGDVKEHR